MILKRIIIIASLLLSSACAGKTIYHWGNYSDSLYSYTTEPSDETRMEHKKELKNIIDSANQKNKKIPPGIYFELAMLEAESGNTNAARKYFARESELFPESATYVKLALTEMEAK